MSRMRSYSSPLRQSNRGTLAPVYQTASMVRASSLADGGAKVATTVKRSSWNSGASCGLSGGAAAAMTSAGAVSGAVSGAVPAISSGIKDSFL